MLPAIVLKRRRGLPVLCAIAWVSLDEPALTDPRAGETSEMGRIGRSRGEAAALVRCTRALARL